MSDNPFESPRAAAPTRAPAVATSLSVGAVLRRSFEIFTVSPLATAGLAALWVATVLLGRAIPKATTPSELWTVQIPASLPFVLVYFLLYAGVLGLARGRSLVEQLEWSGSRLPVAVVVGLSYYLAVCFGVVFFVVPGVYLGIVWHFAVALVLDRRAGFYEAFRRSRALAAGRKGRLFVLFLIPGAVGLAMAGLQIWKTPGFGQLGVTPPLWTALLTVPVYLWQLCFSAAVYEGAEASRSGGASRTNTVDALLSAP